MLVETYWDLGIDDCTAIWFVQFVGREIRIIDYLEDNGQGLDFYADELIKRGYKYAKHHLPHDGGHRQFTNDGAKSIEQMLNELTIRPTVVQERTSDVYADIGKVRGILPRCLFDADKTKDGLKALKNYRREYDEQRQTYKTSPLHDWSSHGADAFRLLAQSIGTTDISSTRANMPMYKARVKELW
jgi:hypothetical protein